MKIGIEIAPILQSKTGVGWYTYMLLAHTAKLKKYDLVALNMSIKNKEFVEKEAEKMSIEADSVPVSFRIYRRLWHAVKYNWLFKSKPDIFHFYNFVVPGWIEGKVIVTIHDMVYKVMPETVEKGNLKYLSNNVKRSAERADIVVTVSESAKSDMIKYLNIDESKIRIVHPGVEYEQYIKEFTEEEKAEIRLIYNLPDKYVLYLGTLEPRKNIETIIDSFALYNKKYNKEGVKLVIAGKKGWLYESIFERIKKQGIEDKVVFTDYLPEEHKAPLYKMSELFLFPTLYEGFGMPVLEAMASGIPVITSNISSLPEVAGDAAILVEPKDTEAICEGINNILSNKELSDEMVRKGFEQYKKFTWEKSAERIMEIYKELESK